jgi:hypothetical protein
MISGQQALRSIEQAAAQVRGQEQQLDTALQSAEGELTRLRAERLAAFRGLAEIRLDAVQREGVVQNIGAAERRALDLIAAGQTAIEALSARVIEARKEREHAEDERHAAVAAVTSALAALEQLQATVEHQVRGTIEWKGQDEAVARAALIADEADKKASLAEADREAKRKPYEADPLFMYLWTRRFGTADYQSGHVVRFFDRKVALLVRYADAKPNYVMLNEIPLRLREHAERCKAAVAIERAKLTAIEAAALTKAGSAPLERALDEARAAAAAADARLEKTTALLATLEAERDKTLGSRESSVYRQAIDVLVEASARQDLRALADAAARTRTSEDDALVRRIETIDAAIARSDRQVESLRADVQTLARRRIEIDRQEAEFRRRGWDNPHGQFSNESVISDVLGGIIKGAIQGHVLGEVLRGGYSQRAPRADSDFGGGGGFNFPFPGGGGGGDGGWIGGGGGGGGGGDFSTGGGF